MEQKLFIAIGVIMSFIFAIFLAWYYSPEQQTYRTAIAISDSAEKELEKCHGLEGQALSDCYLGK